MGAEGRGLEGGEQGNGGHPPAGHVARAGLAPDEFRRHGHALIDWIADYYARVEDYPVRSQVKPGEIRSMLPASAPEAPESFESIMRDLERIIMPGITHWQSPNFYAFFPANTSFPSILGELASAGLGVQGMSWSTSPACTELESHVLDWLVELLDLPAGFRSTTAGGGVIQDTASSATLCAMLAARDRVGRGDNTSGRLVAYASQDAHSSVVKAAGVAGIGRDGLRTVTCLPDRSMDVFELRQVVEADVNAGLRPFFVCSTSGTTSTMAFDPVPEIATVCKEHDMWLHVDGAMAGSAAVCPEFRFVNAGLEAADSYCFNPHKWLLTNFDCDCFYVKNRNHLLNSLSILPEYLRTPATKSGDVIDYRDWQIPLGRRFRALKLWFTLRSYGAEALRAHIRGHVEIADTLAGWIEEDPAFELAAPRHLNLVCFRHRGGDSINERALNAANDSGAVYLTHTRVDDRFTLRLCVGQRTTTLRHVRAAWDLLRAVFSDLA